MSHFWTRRKFMNRAAGSAASLALAPLAENSAGIRRGQRRLFRVDS